MNKNHWRIRFLLWVARRIVRVPIIVNFTPEDMADMYAVGFAWTPQAASRMRGDDLLVQRLQNAEAAARLATGSRKARRIANAAAKRAAKKEAERG